MSTHTDFDLFIFQAEIQFGNEREAVPLYDNNTHAPEDASEAKTSGLGTGLAPNHAESVPKRASVKHKYSPGHSEQTNPEARSVRSPKFADLLRKYNSRSQATATQLDSSESTSEGPLVKQEFEKFFSKHTLRVETTAPPRTSDEYASNDYPSESVSHSPKQDIEQLALVDASTQEASSESAPKHPKSVLERLSAPASPQQTFKATFLSKQSPMRLMIVTTPHSTCEDSSADQSLSPSLSLQQNFEQLPASECSTESMPEHAESTQMDSEESEESEFFHDSDFFEDSDSEASDSEEYDSQDSDSEDSNSENFDSVIAIKDKLKDLLRKHNPELENLLRKHGSKLANLPDLLYKKVLARINAKNAKCIKNEEATDTGKFLRIWCCCCCILQVFFACN